VQQKTKELLPSFMGGGEEMGALIRSYDWSLFPLGNPATWPTSLKTLLQVMLSSRQPMFIA
jgi:hypothetical protein